MAQQQSYWQVIWQQFRSHRLGRAALLVVMVFGLVGVYAPLLASSKPLIAVYDGTVYFPLFRYLFFPGFFSKRIDLFFNILMFTLPFMVAALWLIKGRWRMACFGLLLVSHHLLFAYLWLHPPTDPASDPQLNAQKQEWLTRSLNGDQADPLLRPLPPAPSWERNLQYMTPYDQLNRVLTYRQRKQQDLRLQAYADAYRPYAKNRWMLREAAQLRSQLRAEGVTDISKHALYARVEQQADPEEMERQIAMPTLWRVEQNNRVERRQQLQEELAQVAADYPQARARFDALREDCQRMEGEWKNLISQQQVASAGSEIITRCEQLRAATDQQRAELSRVRDLVVRYERAEGALSYLADRFDWLESQQSTLSWVVYPLLRDFHWEDDAGGEQSLNKHIPWYERTRLNRRDLVAGLLFGIRISLTVGILAIGLALAVGVPIGCLAGYYGGIFDIIVSRLLEIWESMPTFFMLLLVVSITQSKSVFLVIATIGLFGWTGFSRFLRGEFLKQRNLPYVEACQAMGYSDRKVIFRHILPNAVPPLLTLLPFAIMGAIGSEAGLSFLGLGEEDSCSWGVLMDEGRNAFPGESYLLWPPAILLTALLVAIALMGDALRDAIDPKMRR